MAQGLGCLVECGILVPRPGMETMSFALEGRFLTTGPPAKSLFSPAFYYYYYYYWLGLDLHSPGWPFSSRGEWGLLSAAV